MSDGHPPGFFEGTEMPTAGWWEALWPDPAAALAAVGIVPGMDVIDLCAGNGWFTLPIAKIAQRVVALDIDGALLGVARHRVAEAGVANCAFAIGDAYEIATLEPAPVDVVFMANAFHGVPDRPRLARAVRTALKPGGKFVVVNWHARAREETTILGEARGPKTELRMSPAQTIAAVEAGGLAFDRTIELPPYHYAAIFARPAT